MGAIRLAGIFNVIAWCTIALSAAAQKSSSINPPSSSRSLLTLLRFYQLTVPSNFDFPSVLQMKHGGARKGNPNRQQIVTQ